jgi:hypothetical protein
MMPDIEKRFETQVRSFFRALIPYRAPPFLETVGIVGHPGL